MRNRSKNAIAMIMAIAVIVIISTIMALSMSMTMVTTKRNIDMYLYEQAEILADSAREYAMYKIGNAPCVNNNYTIAGQDTFYNIDITVSYVTANPTTCAGPNFTNIADTNLQINTAIIDVTVSIDKSQTKTSEDIRFYKRYIENIEP